jgi:hypothetical protein
VAEMMKAPALNPAAKRSTATIQFQITCIVPSMINSSPVKQMRKAYSEFDRFVTDESFLASASGKSWDEVWVNLSH